MRRLFCVVAILAVTGFWYSASYAQAPRNESSTALAQRVATLESRVQALQKTVIDLQTRLQTFEGSISGYDNRLWAIELARLEYQEISRDLSSRQYQRLDTKIGSLLVSVESAEPYLDGYKVRLNIGNPSYVTYTGFKLKVKWAKKYDSSKFSYASWSEWSKSIREKEIPFTEKLEPGTWNEVELILSPASADQLGYVRLSIETNQVGLRVR